MQPNLANSDIKVPDVSIIVPVYNEAENLRLLFSRTASILAPRGFNIEYLFVNDGSKDASLDIIKEIASNHAGVKYIDLSRNFGHQIAVTAGLDLCTGHQVVIIDADLQDPPELILQLLDKQQEGFEVVYARRRKRAGESFLKLFTARLFYRILASITAIQIPVDTGDFRVISRKVVDALKRMPEQQKFLRGQISWIGFKQTFVEYDRSERAAGITGYTYAKMFRFALDGITSFSDFPLKVASFMGFGISGIAFIVLLYALYGKLFSHTTIDGWASIICAVLFLGGIQLLTIGIIGEYVARVSQNVKARPLYIIGETNFESNNIV